MTSGINILRGTIHGKTIALDEEVGYPDGQVVSVTVVPTLPPGDGLRKSFGTWASESDELDAFISDVREDRKRQRPELG